MTNSKCSLGALIIASFVFLCQGCLPSNFATVINATGSAIVLKVQDRSSAEIESYVIEHCSKVTVRIFDPRLTAVYRDGEVISSRWLLEVPEIMTSKENIREYHFIVEPSGIRYVKPSEAKAVFAKYKEHHSTDRQ